MLTIKILIIKYINQKDNKVNKVNIYIIKTKLHLFRQKKDRNTLKTKKRLIGALNKNITVAKPH